MCFITKVELYFLQHDWSLFYSIYIGLKITWEVLFRRSCASLLRTSRKLMEEAVPIESVGGYKLLRWDIWHLNLLTSCVSYFFSYLLLEEMNADTANLMWNNICMWYSNLIIVILSDHCYPWQSSKLRALNMQNPELKVFLDTVR